MNNLPNALVILGIFAMWMFLSTTNQPTNVSALLSLATVGLLWLAISEWRIIDTKVNDEWKELETRKKSLAVEKLSLEVKLLRNKVKSEGK